MVGANDIEDAIEDVPPAAALLSLTLVSTAILSAAPLSVGAAELR